MATIKRRVTTGNKWVDIFGNNLNTGAVTAPYKTIAQGITSTNTNNIIVIGSGTYDVAGGTSLGSVARVYTGDGVVRIINETSIFAQSVSYINVDVVSTTFGTGVGNPASATNCYFKMLSTSTTNASFAATITSCVINQVGTWNFSSNANVQGTANFTNCTLIWDNFTFSSTTNGVFTNCIFKTRTNGLLTSNIRFAQFVTNSIIANTGSIKFGAQASISLSTATIADLRTSCVAAFGGTTADYFSNCIVADPLFNDETNEDFTIAVSSPAAFYSTSGSYVGARGTAVKFYADADNDLTNATTGSFIASTSTNITLNQSDPSRSNHKFTITDQFDPATPQITSKVIYFEKITELGRAFLQALEAFAIGEVIDWNIDVNTTSTASGALVTGNPYRAVGGSITHNSVTYIDGTYFIAANANYTGTGLAYEASEAPNRKTVGIRGSTGRLRVVAGATLEANTWYAVHTSTSATYNSITYPQYTSFLTGSSPLTHTGGAVVKLFPDSESFVPNEYLYASRGVQGVGGVITRSNGGQDADYTNDTKIYIRAIQIQIRLQRNNNY